MPYPLSNFNVEANYTYTDSSLLQLTRTGFPVGLQDFSENSYNTILTYEDDNWEARVAYNYRDDYYDTLTQANAASMQMPYGQVDAAVRYKINKKWNIGIEVSDLSNDAKQFYQEIEERLIDYTLDDTRFFLTLRGRL